MADFTERVFLEGIVEGAVITAEQAEYAKGKIAKLDARNEKRKATPSKTAIENAPIKEKIVEYLDGKGPTPANAIGEGVGITTQKASALARQLVEEGALEAFEVKVPKKGKVKAYAIAAPVECEVDTEAAE